jgi:hypothetical protein
MEIALTRKRLSEECTIGELTLPDGISFYTLEDKDRGLQSFMPVSEIIRIKRPGITAIPKGRYELCLNFSARFSRSLPLLLDVPGYAGVRIHSGNTAHDTEGCILLGKIAVEDHIMDSRAAMKEFMKWFTEVINKEKVFITIA